MLKYGTKKLENQMEKIKRKTKLSKKKKKVWSKYKCLNCGARKWLLCIKCL